MFSSNRMEHWKIWFLIVVISLSGVAYANDQDLKLTLTEAEGVAGGALFVTCTSDKGIHTMWMNTRGKAISTQKGRVHVESATKGINLVFQNISQEDAGTYKCSSTVDGTQISKMFTLNVRSPISFTNTESEQSVVLHQNATIRCKVEGYPTPTITWRLKDQVINETSKYNITPEGLKIINVSLSDAALYQCQAYQLSKRSSGIESTYITVRVQHKPIWKNPEGESLVYGYLSGVVNLTCHVIAEPKATFQWIKQNKTIEEDDDISIFQDNHTSTLQLTLNNQSMFGSYNCTAHNSFGTTARVLMLKEGKKPIPPSKPTDIEIAADSVQMTITIPEESHPTVTGFRVQYVRGKSEEVSWDEAQTIEFPIHDTITLTNLSQDTDYTIRIQSSTAAGHSDYSEYVDIHTMRILQDTITSGAAMLLTGILVFIFSAISARHLL